MTDIWPPYYDSATRQIEKLAQRLAGMANIELYAIVHAAVTAIQDVVGSYGNIHALIPDWTAAQNDIVTAADEIKNMRDALDYYWTGGAAGVYEKWLDNAYSVLNKFNDDVIGSPNAKKGVLGDLERLGESVIDVVKQFIDVAGACVTMLQHNLGEVGAAAVKITGDAVEIDAEKIADATADVIKSAVDELIKFEKATYKAAKSLLDDYDAVMRDMDDIESITRKAHALQGGFV